jgi:AbrB family looped-hinge helix DNA binding protein
MNTSTITEKGQTTIPVFIRNFLGLNSGGKIIYTTLPDGTVLLKPMQDNIGSLKGFFSAHKPMTLEQIEKAILKRRKSF